MSANLIRPLTAGILALAFSLGVNTAKADDAKLSSPAPAAKAAQKLTDASLKSMLENMGYTTRTEKLGNANLYWISVRHEGLTYELSFQLSPNQEKMWIITSLSDLPKDGKIAADRLLKLLELNDQIGPCYFRINLTHHLLYMSRPLDNREVTPALFRDNMIRMLDRCAETRSAWQIQNWHEPAQTTAQAK